MTSFIYNHIKKDSYCFFILLVGGFLATPLVSQEQEKTIRMEWKPVEGALGYQVQIQNLDGDTILDQRTPTSNIKIKIKSGKYKRRIAAINKLNKVGEWSKWSRFKISEVARPNIRSVIPSPRENADGSHQVFIYGKNFMRSSRVFLVLPGKVKQEIPFQYINQKKISIRLRGSQLGTGKYSINVLNPKGLQDSKTKSLTVIDNKIQYDKKAAEKESRIDTSSIDKTASDDLDFWPGFIPGLPGILREDENGYLWSGAFGSMLILSYLEFEASEITKQQLVSDPLYTTFNNPAYLFLISQKLTTNDLLFWSTILDARHSIIQKKFQLHANNQAIWSGLAMGTLVAHFAVENKEHIRWSHLVPGWTHYKQNNNTRGNAWIAAMSLVATGLAFNESEIQKNQIKSNEIIPDTLTDFVLINSLLNIESSYRSLLFLSRFNQKNRIDSQVLSQSNMQNNLSISFLALYLFQIIDATYVQSGRAEQSVQLNIRKNTMDFRGNSSKINTNEKIHEIEWTYRY